jgi:hypothetical protein
MKQQRSRIFPEVFDIVGGNRNYALIRSNIRMLVFNFRYQDTINIANNIMDTYKYE